MVSTENAASKQDLISPLWLPLGFLFQTIATVINPPLGQGFDVSEFLSLYSTYKNEGVWLCIPCEIINSETFILPLNLLPH